MRRDLITSIVSILTFTVLLGIGYPLLVTGIAQLTMHERASGSRIHVDGKLVGSKLIAQAPPNGSGYFVPRTSQTNYAANASSFHNLGPNQRELADFLRSQRTAYLKRERPYDAHLTAADIPVDAVTNSASGIDPAISVANARIQAHRVARVRGMSLQSVDQLIDAHTAGRAFGLFGEPAVNVLELNLALNRRHPAS